MCTQLCVLITVTASMEEPAIYWFLLAADTACKSDLSLTVLIVTCHMRLGGRGR